MRHRVYTSRLLYKEGKEDKTEKERAALNKKEKRLTHSVTQFNTTKNTIKI